MPFLEQVDGSTTKNIGFVSGTVIIVQMHLFIHIQNFIHFNSIRNQEELDEN